jgi:hypothetical protein
MMDDGRLEYIKVGKRRLIVVDSHRRLVEKQLAEGAPEDHSTDAAIQARKQKLAERSRPPEVDLTELGL